MSVSEGVSESASQPVKPIRIRHSLSEKVRKRGEKRARERDNERKKARESQRELERARIGESGSFSESVRGSRKQSEAVTSNQS